MALDCTGRGPIGDILTTVVSASDASVLARRLFGFSLLPIISVLSPLVALPVLARASSVADWASISIGQSVGAVAAVFVGAGWNVTGPSRAARAPRGELPALVLESSRGRLAALIVAVPACVAIAAAVSIHDRPWLAAANSIGTLLPGLAVTWFAVGTGRPGLMVWTDVLPRVLTNIAGAALAATTGNLYYYPLIVVLGNLPLAIFYLRTVPSTRRLVSFAAIGRNGASLGTEVLASAYSMGATVFIGLTASVAVVAHFNAGYRLASIASVVIGVLGSTLQAWVAAADGRAFGQRVRTAAWLHLALGVAGWLGLIVLGPWVSRLLFGAALAPSRGVLTAFGAFFCLWSVETVTARHVLAARERTRVLLSTTAIGSVCGIVLLIAFAQSLGAAGCAYVMTAAMALIIATQIPACIALIREESR